MQFLDKMQLLVLISIPYLMKDKNKKNSTRLLSDPQSNPLLKERMLLFYCLDQLKVEKPTRLREKLALKEEFSQELLKTFLI